MAFELGSSALFRGYRLAEFERIGSTSTEAAARARAGDPGRLWVVAGEQTAGYGRRGRHWQTPPGNLAASVLVLSSVPPGKAATLGFAAGLALATAIERAGAGRPLPWRERASKMPRGIQLKWPNDVLIGGAKVAGILLEAIGLIGGRHAIVVGIGVNVGHAPADVTYPTTSLAACGSDATAEALFAELSDAWVEQEDFWQDGKGFAALRRNWLERAAGFGGPISVQLGDEVVRGTFETIDEEGQLVVREPNGATRSVSAGEVHFGAAATMAG